MTNEEIDELGIQLYGDDSSKSRAAASFLGDAVVSFRAADLILRFVETSLTQDSFFPTSPRYLSTAQIAMVSLGRILNTFDDKLLESDFLNELRIRINVIASRQLSFGLASALLVALLANSRLAERESSLVQRLTQYIDQTGIPVWYRG